MRKTLLGSLTSLLIPFAAYGANISYGAYQRRQSTYIGAHQPLPLADGQRHSFAERTFDASAAELDISAGAAATELVIIDAAVPDKHILYRAAKPGVDIVEITSTESGLAQLTGVLSRYRNLSALHIVSHALHGELLLGNSRITAENIKQEIEAFAALNGALRDGGDLLLYGCDLAAGDAGTELLEIIQGNTHLDVAASSDKTGARDLTGDWELEISTGNIETELPFSDKALKDFSAILAAANGTYDFSGFTDGGATLTSTDFIVSAKDSTGAPSVPVSIYGSAAYLSGDVVSISNYFYVTADGVNTGSFELTGLAAAEYYTGEINLTNVRIVGILRDNSQITSTELDGSLATGDEDFIFGAGQLSNFAGVQLKAFKLYFDVTTRTPAGGGGGPHVGDASLFDFSSFTIANAQAPNTAPTLTTITPLTDATEDTPFTISYANLAAAADEADGDGDPLSFRVEAISTGTLTKGGTAVTAGATLLSSGEELEWMPAADANGTLNAFTVTAWDGTAASSPAVPVQVGVTATNDAPVVTVPGSISINEDSSIAVTGISFADIDAGTGSVTATLSVPSGAFSATSGSGVTVGGTTSALTLTGTVANINAFIAASNVTYTTANNATFDVTLTVSIDDGGNTGTGGALSDSDTTTLQVTAVNDAPVATVPGSLSVTEDVSTALTGISFADQDAGTGDVTATFSVPSGTLAATSGGGVTVGGTSSALTLTGTMADINAYIAASSVAYTTASNATADVTLTVDINDGGNTGTGGEGTDSRTVTLDVTPVNDAPTDITLNPASIDESATSAGATVGTLTSIDPDSGATHTYALVADGSSDSGDCGATGADDNASFQIDNANDELETVGSLDPGSYSICIQTSDGTDSYQENITITVSDDVAPSGHSVTFDNDSLNGSEATSTSFTFADAELGADYSYTISSSGGGTPVTGTGTIVSAGDQISGIDVSGLSDGTLTLSVTLTDSASNSAGAVTATATLDASAPSGHSASFDDAVITDGEQGSISFTFAGAEVGAEYSYTIDSSAGGTAVTGAGTITSDSQQISGIDVSGLSDGTLTLSVVLTDSLGNAATAVTNTATLDVTAPTPSITTAAGNPINAAFTANISFGEAVSGFDLGDITAGNATLSSFTDNGSGDFSVLMTPTTDGSVTLDIGAAVAQDGVGNNNLAATQFSLVYDATAPSAVFSSLESSPSNSASFPVTLDFGETVAGFLLSQITTGNATLSGLTDNGDGNYSFTVTPTTNGSVTLDYAANTVQDSAGNNNTAAAQFSLTWDGNAPTLDSSTPADNATGVAFDADLVLTFSENVIARAGLDAAIELYDSGDNLVTTAIVTSSDVSVSGNIVTVDFFPDLWPTMSYYVHISGTAFEDAAGNLYAGFADETTLNFTIGNDAPVASDDSGTTDEDTAVAIDVLANDTDSDSSLNAASTIVVTPPANGSTSVNTASGVITYTPDDDFNGSDSFTYTVEDVQGGKSNTATVSITITAINDAPVAVNDLESTPEDTNASFDIAANDTDVDTGDSVDNTTITIVTPPANGSATINAGQVDYDPDADFNGTDTFTYTIEDQNGALSNIATVTINVIGVNDLPTAIDDSDSVDEDDSVDIDVLNNDSDIDGTLDSTTVTVMANPANGSTSVDALTGVITYTPSADYNGSDSFTYVVRDDAGGTSNAATVTLTVNSVNDAPVAANDTAVMLEDTAHEVNVLGNDSDVDGTLVPASVEVVTGPAEGSVSINAATGAITYTPDNDFSGSDAFTYRVQDNDGAWSAPATVTMTVNNVNDAPIAVDDTATTDDETPVVITILANDTDIDDGLNNASVVIVSPPVNGSVIDHGDGSVTYTPDAAFIGSDSFTYTVDDNTPATSNTATVTITVIPGNEIPVIRGSAPTSVTVGEAYSFAPTASDADMEDTLTFSITGQPAWLSFNTATGELSGTPADADVGSSGNIVITVSDGEEIVSLPFFAIEVTAGPDSDGDTVSDYQEELDQTDPADPADYLDLVPPVLSAPDDRTLDAIGLYTPVHLKQLLGLALSASNEEVDDALNELATDNIDGNGCCSPMVEDMLDSIVLLPPGSNEITWLTEDRMGNMAEITQIVNLRPLVSLSKDQTTVEGNTVTISVILNGESPFYPLTVPFVIDETSTVTDSDHDLINGTVTFTEPDQTQASITITITEDGMSDDNETLLVRLDDRTSNAEDLADGYDPLNPDIYDINSGAKAHHVIRIVEGNLPPDATLQLQQDGVNRLLVTPDGGPVTATVSVRDPNPGDFHELDWSASDNTLADTDGDSADETLVFDPSGLNPGRYKAQVAVTDSEGATTTVRLFFQVVASLPALSAEDDTDGDGVDDSTEGTGDSDGDGIPDYLDNISASNVLPEQAAQSRSYLIECEPGVRCDLGQFSLLGELGGAQLEEDLNTLDGLIPDPDYTPVGGIFDFTINLSQPGQIASIVIPQPVSVPEDAVYRKFRNGAWFTFATDDNNGLYSADGRPGYCPPPNDETWQSGLTPGHLCVQLVIEDGGPNDADGMVNGTVEDPGAVSIPNNVVVYVDSESGGGAFDKWLLALFGSLWLFGGLAAKRGRRPGKALNHLGSKAASIATLLFCGSLIFTATPTQAQTWFDDKVSLELGIYHTESAKSSGAFISDMAAEGVTVDLLRYETNRNAWQIAVDYKFSEWVTVQLGYLDLGDVRVGFFADSPDYATIEQALEKHYPFSADGLTLAYRYRYAWREHFEFTVDAGLFNWDQDIDVRFASLNPDGDSGTDPLLGLGIDYRINTQAAVGLRYQRLMLDPGDMDLWGGTINWRF